MTENVTALHGVSLGSLVSGTAVPEVVSRLEDLLAQARRGEIAAFVAVAMGSTLEDHQARPARDGHWGSANQAIALYGLLHLAGKALTDYLVEAECEE